MCSVLGSSAHVFGVLAFRAAKESFIVLDLQILEGTTQQGSARVESAAARRGGDSPSATGILDRETSISASGGVGCRGGL